MSSTIKPLFSLLTGGSGPGVAARRARLREEPSAVALVGPEAVAEELRRGMPVRDERFDQLFSPFARQASRIHWTPIEVCRRIVKLLELKASDRVLDVGCGAGKLCVVGSLLSPAVFVGVEQRPHLVEEAKKLAARLGSPAEFIHANALDLDWAGYSTIYFYNPFDELRFDPSLRIDDSLEFGDDVFHATVAGTREKLSRLALGTRVVTFHGMGGQMPGSYSMQSSNFVTDGILDSWVQKPRLT